MEVRPEVVTYGKPDGYRDVHIGHLSGVVLHADAYARYCRAVGKETWLISGTDGYGAAVYQNTFQQLGHVPSNDELRLYVQKYHLRQCNTLATYLVSNDYYGLDTDLKETKYIKSLCDELLLRIWNSGNGILRKEMDHCDQIMGCPLGNRHLIKEDTANVERYRSLITGTLTIDVPVENWYLSLEAYRTVIETSLQRFDDPIRDSRMIAYVKNMLKKPLPDYRLTSYQPWSVQVFDESEMKYQVWVESLLAPVVYMHHVAIQRHKKILNPHYVQFIAEDTLFFYTIVQPVLWHILWPEQELSTLLCNSTRTFINELGQRCFMTGDELLQKFSVNQIRVCMISRGTGHTTIAFTTQEMNRLWKGYLHAARHITNYTCQATLDNAQRYWQLFSESMQKLDFSKAADIADEYFHSKELLYDTCYVMMSCIAPGFLVSQ